MSPIGWFLLARRALCWKRKAFGRSAILALTTLGLFILSIGPLYARGRFPTIYVSVDAADAPRGILHSRLHFETPSGDVTLLYPKWIPGEHSPTGPIGDVVGLKLMAAGEPIEWHRDPVDMYAIHCRVPAGIHSLDVSFDYVQRPLFDAPIPSNMFGTASLAILNWNLVLFYPRAWDVETLTYVATLRLPAGWQFGTALGVAQASDDGIRFVPVSLATLVDSPVIAGAHYRAIKLETVDSATHELDVASDSALALEIDSLWLRNLNRLISEVGALYGARHYEKYHFLLALSDQIAIEGMEHRDSSDNRIPVQALTETDWQKRLARLLPHEFIHSWNGKYRRPAGLTTHDYDEPMLGELLWVYEGLTRYLDGVLTVRSGLWTSENYREYLAYVAADLDHRSGRSWRPLSDTAIAVSILNDAPEEWASWRRGTDDYYDESVLIWLEADVKIRLHNSTRSLDDFCRMFYGSQGSSEQVVRYDLGDLLSALNTVDRESWTDFFQARIYTVAPNAPLGGIEGSGWRLVYNEVPNEYLTALDRTGKRADLSFSLGLKVRDDGVIVDVVMGSTAGGAGLSPGMRLVAVNGRGWSPTALQEALKAVTETSSSITLLVDNAQSYSTYSLDYHGENKYPHLVRDAARPDVLSAILRSRTNAVDSGER